MSQIERSIKGPTSTPEEISQLVSTLSSPSVTAPRQLSSALRQRLDQVAAKNGGNVPLHGRLFAQWIHHAFPRECPFPHEAGLTNPQTPDEWMKETGQTSSSATEEEMVCFTNGECGKVLPVLNAGSGDSHTDTSALDSLPWSDTEVLLVDKASSVAHQSSSWSALSRALRMIVLSTAALGLTYFAKMSMEQPEDDPAGKLKRQVKNRGACLTLALLLFPLVVLSFDYLFDYDANEVFICVLCWGLVCMLMWSFGQRQGTKQQCLARMESLFSGNV
jgi:hypothetical protein